MKNMVGRGRMKFSASHCNNKLVLRYIGDRSGKNKVITKQTQCKVTDMIA